MHNYMTNGREEVKVINTDGQPTIANGRTVGGEESKRVRDLVASLAVDAARIAELEAVNASLAAKYDEIHALWMASEAKLERVAAALAGFESRDRY